MQTPVVSSLATQLVKGDHRIYMNILLPVLFDEEHDTDASFRAAKTLADDGAKVTVMHVLEAIPVYATSHVLAEALITAREEVEGRLEETANKLPGSHAYLPLETPRMKSSNLRKPTTWTVSFSRRTDRALAITSSAQRLRESYATRPRQCM